MTGKYVPFEQHFSALSISQHEIAFSFEKIDQILNSKLPPSAYKYSEWWANEKHPRSPQKQAWMNAGWQVDTVNFNEKWVRFRRERENIV